MTGLLGIGILLAIGAIGINAASKSQAGSVPDATGNDSPLNPADLVAPSNNDAPDFFESPTFQSPILVNVAPEKTPSTETYPALRLYPENSPATISGVAGSSTVNTAPTRITRYGMYE